MPRPINDTARVNWIAEWLRDVTTLEDNGQVKTVEISWASDEFESHNDLRLSRSGRSMRAAFRKAVDAAMHEQVERRKKR